ncbi:MAG TPA: chloride channel protein [Rhodopila sp.]|nr:chloride channel protein [Rhodopila sp.]
MKRFLGNRRHLRIQSVRTQRRVIFLLGGVVVGGAAVILAILADQAQSLFARLIAQWPYASLVVTPLGMGVAAWMTRRFFPNSQGSGIPQAIAARHLQNQAARGRLVSIRIAIGKILLTLFGLLCGASIGREGPTVQVGASIMFAIGGLSLRRQKGLILAGASAGIAAAFNTPLAGIIFGIEEMSRAFEVQATGLMIGGIVVAGLTSVMFLGDYTYFGTTSVALHGIEGWMALPVCAVTGGLTGGLFSRILIIFGKGLPGTIGRAIKRHPVWFAVICGLLAATAGIASGNTVFGTGYSQVRGVMDYGRSLPQSFSILKFAATTLASISGVPGGIFSPSLAVGAGIGFNLGSLFTSVPMNALILLGMVSYFTGVVQAPITAVVIVAEMTNDHAMVLPLMVAAAIAYGASRLVCPEGVYHALARNFIAASHAGETHGQARSLTAGDQSH